jgi:hypothetical protein
MLLAVAILALAGGSAWALWSWTARSGLAAETAALASAASLAADRIRTQQEPAGYWLTAVTPGLAFERPTTEVNVFVPAVVVDLLDPIAEQTGLGPAVARARAWLTGQIEDTGLVRYHGNPGPGPPPTPGCELPPDSDDTALVWRVAPRAETSLRDSARATIEGYRTDDGLYRVWLAPEETHQCFYKYSGRELNPADVAIQMHLHLFFAGYDPPAARRLCDALGRRMTDDGIWVYYEVAPLIPRLREVDLALAGCPLRVPEARLRDQPSGQEPYLQLAELRRRILLDEDGAGARAAALPLLARLAADGFAAIVRTPPLVYHNDLTATPPHYHWSADLGYALWLRAYADAIRRPGAAGARP